MEVNGSGGGALLDVEEGWCRTPTHDGCRLPEAKVPPPPPRKKPFNVNRKNKKKTTKTPPEGGYFQPPDLELFFSIITPRRKSVI